MHFRTATIAGVEIFHREAGDPSNPAIVMLHGFPSSSHSFPGIGYSVAPEPNVLRPTFEEVTRVIDAFIAQRVSGPVILYIHDFGGPIGMRIALALPRADLSNTVIASEGRRPGIIEHYDHIDGPETPEKLTEAEQSASDARDQYLHKTGAQRPDALNPDSWAIDAYAFGIPASRTFMTRRLVNIPANVPHDPEWIAFLEKRQSKTLIVWGCNDPLMAPAGAEG